MVFSSTPWLKAFLFSINRKRLFSLINDLPTVFEVVTERKPIKDKPSVDSGSKSKISTKVNYSKLKDILFLFLGPVWFGGNVSHSFQVGEKNDT